jgi:hypothetical protein
MAAAANAAAKYDAAAAAAATANGDPAKNPAQKLTGRVRQITLTTSSNSFFRCNVLEFDNPHPASSCTS